MRMIDHTYWASTHWNQGGNAQYWAATYIFVAPTRLLSYCLTFLRHPNLTLNSLHTQKYTLSIIKRRAVM